MDELRPVVDELHRMLCDLGRIAQAEELVGAYYSLNSDGTQRLNRLTGAGMGSLLDLVLYPGNQAKADRFRDLVCRVWDYASARCE